MPTFTDIFCGAGGSSIGLAGAGYELRLAANHWDRAIETHSANFPDAEHVCADVNNYDMRRLPKTDVLWASPICTEISPAGGRRRKKVPGQGDLLEEFGHVDRAAFDRTRATAHDVIRATEVHRYDAVMCENVPEFAEWELFEWWLDGMRRLGYQHQTVCVSSAHVGSPTNPWAPQWRDRLYIVFTRSGIPLPDVTPRPLAYCQSCAEDVPAVQWWKNARSRKIGRYRSQYLYRCPNRQCRNAVVEPYVLPAASAIDWSDLGTRIGDRARPLAANTVRRIQAGLEMFAQPTMLAVNHDDGGRAYPAAAAPLPARTVKIGDGLACPPMLVPAGGTWNNTPEFTDQPFRTRTARDMEAVVTPEPFITMLRGNATARGLDEPLGTVMTGRHHGLTVPPGAFYVKNYGGNAEPGDMVKDVDQPLGSVTTKDHHALVVPYYRTGRAKSTNQPLDTVTGRDRFALVGTAVEVDDCHFRMLKPREHLRAQRFPDGYIVHGNQGEQTMQAGNAVSANVAQWLGERVAIALGERSA